MQLVCIFSVASLYFRLVLLTATLFVCIHRELQCHVVGKRNRLIIHITFFQNQAFCSQIERKTKPRKLARQFTIASNFSRKFSLKQAAHSLGFFLHLFFSLSLSLPIPLLIRNKSSRKIFEEVEFFYLISVVFFLFILSHLSPRLM